MNTEESWRNARNSRSLRYAGRVLDPTRGIVLRSDCFQASRFDGQVSIITAATLLCRMTPAVKLDIPQVPIVSPLPWAGTDLRQFVLDLMFKADPFGHFEHRAARESDYVIQLGIAGGSIVTHGSGWNVYLGPEPSPVRVSESFNPIGPAMAAILSATAAFKSDLTGLPESVVLNTFDWRACETGPDTPELPNEFDLGEIWVAGTGSVGTAVLYFLTLATRRFAASLIDMDIVKVHNLDRSPVFNDEDVGKAKTEATATWLRNAGLLNVRCDPHALDESALWHERNAGTPDVLVAAANERNVRSIIEAGFPPIQIYGTTGKLAGSYDPACPNERSLFVLSLSRKRLCINAMCDWVGERERHGRRDGCRSSIPLFRSGSNGRC
jgi:hypothetical protein